MNNDNRDKFYEDEQRKIAAEERTEYTESTERTESTEHTERAKYAENTMRAEYAQPENERSNYDTIEDAEYTPVDSAAAQKQETGKPQGPTYYSYGQTRPMQAVQAPQYTHAGNQSFQGAPGSHFQSGQPSYQYGHGTGPTQPMPPHAPQRTFTTSTVGGDPLASKKEKKRSSGFGKMFLSFMAGVVAVGLLMYTADVQNWFSSETVATSNNSYNNGSSQAPSNGATQGTTTSLMMDRPDNISQLFSSSSPAVVKIETYSKATRNGANSLFNDPFFRQFFGNNVPNSSEEESEELEQSGMGTGFFFDSSGYILTNQHVISDAAEIRVLVEGYDEPFIATQLGSSYELDLAVLKIEGEQQFPMLPLGNSNDTQIGDWVLAIGNPYGFDHTLTVGVISAKERPIDISDSEGTRNYKNLLQTDASINPGNSGGPLLNMNGEVIGINTAVSSTAQGIGFAIPTSTITEVLNSLKNNETLPADAAPFIGVDLQDLTENIASQLGLKNTEGTLVRNVYYNSPAYRAGMKQYDVITAVDGNTVKIAQDLIDYIGEQQVGDTVELTITRDGESIQLSVEIGDKNQFGL